MEGASSSASNKWSGSGWFKVSQNCLAQRWSCSASVRRTRPFCLGLGQSGHCEPLLDRTMRFNIRVSFWSTVFLCIHAFGFDPLSLAMPAAAFNMSGMTFTDIIGMRNGKWPVFIIALY